jgi:hypothetical protein
MKDIMLHRISLANEDKFCKISLVHGISKVEFLKLENRFMITSVWGRTVVRERKELTKGCKVSVR